MQTGVAGFRERRTSRYTAPDFKSKGCSPSGYEKSAVKLLQRSWQRAELKSSESSKGGTG